MKLLSLLFLVLMLTPFAHAVLPDDLVNANYPNCSSVSSSKVLCTGDVSVGNLTITLNRDYVVEITGNVFFEANANIQINQTGNFNLTLLVGGSITSATNSSNPRIKADLNVNNNLSLGQGAQLEGNIAIGNIASFDQSSQINGTVNVGSDLNVGEFAAWAANTVVNGSAVFAQNVMITGNTQIGGNGTFSNNASINGNVAATNALSFGVNSVVNGNCSAASGNYATYCATTSPTGQLTGNLTADNMFEAYLSIDDSTAGTLISTGSRWADTYSLAASLTPGQDYYLHIRASDTSSIAAFIGSFEIAGIEHTFANGLGNVNTSTVDWLVSTTGWENYLTPTSYGTNGVGPWGAKPSINANAEWIWSADYNNDDVAYFTTSILATSMVAPTLEYRFDECSYTGMSGDVIDESGNFNGSSNGLDAPISESVINASLDLSANDITDWVALPSAAIDGLNDFSISLWFKTGVSTFRQQILHTLGNDVNDDELEIYLQNDDTVFVSVNSTTQAFTSSIVLTNDNWHHLAISRKGVQVCLLIDGVSQGCNTNFPSDALSVPNSPAVVLGQEQDAFGGGFRVPRNFIGQLDEFKIFDIGLSGRQINDIYQNELAGGNYDGSARVAAVCPINFSPVIEYRFDECTYTGAMGDVLDQGSNFNGQSNGLFASLDDAIVNKSLDLSASDTSDWVKVPSGAVNGLGDFTVSIWFKTGVSKSQQDILQALGSDVNDEELEIYLQNSNDITFKIQDNSNLFSSSVPLTDNNWHHLVITRRGPQACLFLNAMIQSCIDTGVSGTLSVVNADAVIIGQEQDSFGGSFSASQSFEGQLDEFKIFDASLSDRQIESLYQNELAGSNYDGGARAPVSCSTNTCDTFGTLSAIGLKIDSVGRNTNINNTTEALSIYNQWIAEGSPTTGFINAETYNIFASGSSEVDRIDFGGSANDYAGTLAYPGASAGVGGEDFLVHASGTISLPAGDYTIHVESDDGFSFVMETVAGDDVLFNKFRGSADGASNELRFENPTGNSNTGGSFTLGQESVFEIAAIFWERQGGDYFEISILDDIDTSNTPTTGYEILSHGALNGKVVFGCPQPKVVAGRVTLRDTSNQPAFTAVCFDKPFSEVPRVFSIPSTADNDDRLALRIRNVTVNGFEIAQVESPERANPNPPAGNVSQTIDFIALEEGDYELDGGALMRVSSINTTDQRGSMVSGDAWETVSTADLNFSQAPAVIASIQTMNNESDPFPFSEPFLATTIRNVSSTDFQMLLERGETSTGAVTNNETIAYLAIPPGLSGQLTQDITYESFLTNRNINGINTCTTVGLNGNYSGDLPLVIASQNTRQGGDGGWVKRCAISPNSVGFSIVEDMDRDSDTQHANEEVGGLALGGTFTNQTCAIQPPSVHHYALTFNEQGLTCDTETVTISACANASCSNLSTQVVALDLLANGALVSSEAFTGSTVVNLNNTTEQTLSLSLANMSIAAPNPVVCNNSSANACEMTFSAAGFRFLYGAGTNTFIPNQVAGNPFPETLRVQAVQNNNGVCEGLFSGDREVALSQENIDPGGVSGNAFTVNGSNIAKHPSSTLTTLNFGSDSIAVIPSPNYLDAGRIRLHAEFNDAGVVVAGSSNAFWVRPAELAVSASAGGVPLNGASALATPIHKAGEDFVLSVSALNSAGAITPNYSPGQIQFSLARTGPLLVDSADGDLRYASTSSLTSSEIPIFENVNLNPFSAGVSTFSAAQYSEVGLLNLDLQDSNYGNVGIVVPASAIDIGRFIPDHFQQTVVDDGFFHARCGSTMTFTSYSGQKNEANNSLGAISYLNNPVLAITAYNKQGNITQNYFQDSQGSSNDFMKLSEGDVSIVPPSFDQVTTGVNASLLPLTANMYTGTLSQNDLTALPNVVALPRGVLHYRFSDADNFYYNRDANALVAPFTSDIDFSVASITDADNVNMTTRVNASPTGVEIRFGRLLLENSFGPETNTIPQVMQLEHYNGSTFVASIDDNCQSYDASRMSLSNISLDPALTAVLGGSGKFVDGRTQSLELQATGSGNQGQIGVAYDAYDWLKYDWDNDGVFDNDPSAVAAFGQFRGDDRTIHWREGFNN